MSCVVGGALGWARSGITNSPRWSCSCGSGASKMRRENSFGEAAAGAGNVAGVMNGVGEDEKGRLGTVRWVGDRWAGWLAERNVWLGGCM